MFISWGKAVSVCWQNTLEKHTKKKAVKRQQYQRWTSGGEENAVGSGAGLMNNSGMIALKIGQYNKTCR